MYLSVASETLCTFSLLWQIAFTTKKDYGKEEREAQWALAQRTLHGLQPPETAGIFSEKSSYRELSEIAEQAKRRAEVARYEWINLLRLFFIELFLAWYSIWTDLLKIGFFFRHQFINQLAKSVLYPCLRLRELHTLKGHVESVVKLKGLDIDTIQQHYTV